MSLPSHISTPQPLPEDKRSRSFPFARFWSKVDKPSSGVLDNSCWEFTGARHPDGYGVFWLDGRSRQAHRVAWEFKYGPIPDGLILLHKCDNPPCVRVDPSGPPESDHFYVGTVSENNTDRDIKRRGVALVGNSNGNVKLDADIVRSIRVGRANGETYSSLAFRYNVSAVTIGRIVKRQTWGHID